MRSELLTEMYLIEILLLGREDDRSRPRSIRGCATITEQYDGVTVSPARQSRQRKNHDDIIVFDVMTDKIARRWRKKYRERLREHLLSIRTRSSCVPPPSKGSSVCPGS